MDLNSKRVLDQAAKELVTIKMNLFEPERIDEIRREGRVRVG